MKKHFTIYLMMLLASMAGATVHTVDNNTNSPAQFKGVTALQDAINGVPAGDTLYVSGSLTSYGNVTLNKRLTLIGPGHNPLNEISIPATLGYISLDSIASTSGPSFSKIIGFKMDRVTQYFSNGDHYRGIEIARNYFYTGSTFDNLNDSYSLYVHNNIFYQNYFAFGDNSIISNNIFIGNNGIRQIGTNSILSHNIFLDDVIGAFTPEWSGCTLENNIFYAIRLDTSITNITSCSFYNNIGYLGNYLTLPFGSTNAGTGNLITNPLFVSVPLYNVFNYSYDYHLQTGSPGHNTATDGTDRGLYGGPVNSVPDLTGMGRMPYMKYLHLTQSIIAPSDSLNVQFKAIKHD